MKVPVNLIGMKKFLCHPATIFLAGMALLGFSVEMRLVTLGVFAVGLIIVSLAVVISSSFDL